MFEDEGSQAPQSILHRSGGRVKKAWASDRPDDQAQQAPYSIAPGIARRKPRTDADEGPQPPFQLGGGVKKAWTSEDSDARDSAEARAAGSVWGGTELGPRLSIDTVNTLGRRMYLDRSRQFSELMLRLDELERLGD